MWAKVTLGQAQITQEQAIKIALLNNRELLSMKFQTQATQKLIRASSELPKTNILYTKGQYNSFSKADNNFTITQSIPFQILGSQRALAQSVTKANQITEDIKRSEVIFEIKKLYTEYEYLWAQEQLLAQQDSLYSNFLKIANTRYAVGEGTLLEKITAETQHSLIKNKQFRNKSEQFQIQLALQSVIQTDTLPLIELKIDNPQFYMPDKITLGNNNLSLRYAKQATVVAQDQKRVENSKIMPELLIGYFNQTLLGAINPANSEIATLSNRFSGFQIGIALPIWFAPHQAKGMAAKLNVKACEQQYLNQQKILSSQLAQSIEQHKESYRIVQFFQQAAIPNAQVTLKQAISSFTKGEISYAEYLLALQRFISIKEESLLAVKDYKQTTHLIEYLNGYVLQEYEKE
jgi:cobalt-zinc-cadmium resistance protein CzcA